MIKNILSVCIFFFAISFFFFIINTYFSDNQKKKIKKSRELISQTIKKNIEGLPILPNNTDDVIEFNSGFDNKINRNFWKLFKKND
jgi:hypothetical protein